MVPLPRRGQGRLETGPGACGCHWRRERDRRRGGGGGGKEIGEEQTPPPCYSPGTTTTTTLTPALSTQLTPVGRPLPIIEVFPVQQTAPCHSVRLPLRSLWYAPILLPQPKVRVVPLFIDARARALRVGTGSEELAGHLQQDAFDVCSRHYVGKYMEPPARAHTTCYNTIPRAVFCFYYLTEAL